MGFSCYAITITNHSPLKPLKNLIFSNLMRPNHTQTRTRVDDDGFRPDPSLVLLPLHLTTGSVNKDRLREVDYATFVSHKEEEEEESECAVCLSRIEAWHHVRELGNCEHAFHVGCIDSWMDRSGSTCPVCRAALVSVRGEEESDGKDPWRSQRMVYLFGEDCFIDEL